jgi:hypothetical protein
MLCEQLFFVTQIVFDVHGIQLYYKIQIEPASLVCCRERTVDLHLESSREDVLCLRAWADEVSIIHAAERRQSNHIFARRYPYLTLTKPFFRSCREMGLGMPVTGIMGRSGKAAPRRPLYLSASYTAYKVVM